MFNVPKPLHLTREEAEVLEETLNQHIDQLVESKNPTIEDPNVNTNETLLEVMAQIDEDIKLHTSIRKKVRHV